MSRKQEVSNPYKQPAGTEAAARLMGDRLLSPQQQKRAARLRRQQIRINRARNQEPLSERASKNNVAVRLARPLLKRLEAGADIHAGRAQKRAEGAAKRHYQQDKEAYQSHALVDDADRTAMLKRLDQLTKATPEQMAALAISQGSSPREVATIWQHTNERQAATKAENKAEREKGILALEKVPGTDPVLAMVDGHAEDIPKSGWLVTSHVAPGYGGRIDIYKYDEGQLELREPDKDNREEYGETRVHFRVNGGEEHTIAYENPAFPNPSTEPYDRMSPTSYTGLSFDRTDLVPLSNGGRLLDEKNPMGTYPKGINLSTSMDWRDFSRESMRELSSDFPVNRITADQEDLTAILGGIGEGMGLEQPDIETMLNTIDQKISPAEVA